MRKLTLTLTAAALAIGGSTAALADHHGGKRDGMHGPDADGDGIVTQAEATAHSAAMWAKMDANGDGFLDAADREIHKAERQAKMAEKRAEHFAKLDTDGSGELSQDELKAGREARSDQMGTGKGDGKGKHRMAGKRGKRGGDMGMMRRADTDGDKRISRAEFDAGQAKMFARADTDGNGSITQVERDAARAAMKERMQQKRAEKAAS